MKMHFMSLYIEVHLIQHFLETLENLQDKRHLRRSARTIFGLKKHAAPEAGLNVVTDRDPGVARLPPLNGARRDERGFENVFTH